MIYRSRGITLIEVTAAIVLLATMVGICVQMLAALALQQRVAERRTWAIETATNLMERYAARDWNDVTPETAATLSLEPETSGVLADAKLAVEVIEEQTPVAAKQVRLNLSWDEPQADRSPTVRLSSWVFQQGRPSP